MSGLDFIEKLITDVHALKVLLFALYGWSLAVSVSIGLLFARLNRKEDLTITTFAEKYGVSKAALIAWLFSTGKKDGPDGPPPWRK